MKTFYQRLKELEGTFKGRWKYHSKRCTSENSCATSRHWEEHYKATKKLRILFDNCERCRKDYK